MLGYLSLKYRYSGSKFCSLLSGHKSIKISAKSDIKGCNSWYPSLFATKQNLKPSYIYKSSHKSIGSLKGEVGFLSLRHLYTILDSKNCFPSTDTKWMIATTSQQQSPIDKEVTYDVWLNLKIANHLGEPTIGRKSQKITPLLIPFNQPYVNRLGWGNLS